MNDQRLTCAELHQVKDPKRQQVKPKGTNYSILVNEQEMDPAELNLHIASQDFQRTDKNSRCKGRYIAEILGIICLVLMSTVVKIALIPCKYVNFHVLILKEFWIIFHNLSPAHYCSHCPKKWFIYSNDCYNISTERKPRNETCIFCVCLPLLPRIFVICLYYHMCLLYVNYHCCLL
uniref:Uncharacterized protein n=1 Tax=Suricata suricatta TaxID=37032 RepID=A0A673U3T7_SURSU